MAYQKAKMIRAVFKELETLEALALSLTRSYENYESLLAVLKKYNPKNKKEMVESFYLAVQKERNDLANVLKGIAQVFNDTEYEIFCEYVLKNKTKKQIIYEVDRSWDYVNHVISKINKILEQHFDSIDELLEGKNNGWRKS